ncbi:MAG: sigma-E factor regulatory protein RseB domain-containing protein [Planctomycetota bacterium]
MRLITPLLFSLSLVVLAGCLPEESDRAAFLGLTAESVSAAEDVAYSAVRRYTDYVGMVPGEHTERFTRADRERYRVDLLTLNGLSRGEMASPGEVEQFDQLQALFQGGRGRYVAKGRDFRLRDLELFEANYSYVLYDAPVMIAGRLADVVEVTPHFGERPSYVAWIDRETSVTLKYLEFLSNGALAAEMEVLSFDAQPDLSSVQFPVPPVTEPVELDEVQVQSFAPFQVLSPTYLPRGFARQSIRARQLTGVSALTWSYSDGLQELFMMQYTEQGGGSTGEALPARVGMTAYGPLTDAEFAVIGTQVHVGAKLDVGEVMTFIESLDLLIED